MKVGEIKHGATPYILIAPDYKEVQNNEAAYPQPEFDGIPLNKDIVCLLVDYRTYQDVPRKEPLNNPPKNEEDLLRIIFEIKIKYVVPIELAEGETVSVDEFYKILHSVWMLWLTEHSKLAQTEKAWTPGATFFARKDDQLDVLTKGIAVLNSL